MESSHARPRSRRGHGDREGKSEMSKSPKSPKRKRYPTMTVHSALDALIKLTDAPATHEHLERWHRETTTEKNDRGAAILMATNVENALQSALAGLMWIRKGQNRKLFGINAPVGSFANKITLAYALEIIGDETYTNLELIRGIRNAFAHAKQPIDFDSSQIKDACAFMIVPPITGPELLEKDREPLVGRKRFQKVCHNTAHNLLMFYLFRTVEIPEGWLNFQPPADAYAVLLHRPLP
jgi:hypothetical protein